MATNGFTVEELTELETMFNEKSMAAAAATDSENFKKYGKLALRTSQMIETANAPKKERQPRKPRASAPTQNDPDTPNAETTPPESPERSSRKGRSA